MRHVKVIAYLARSKPSGATDLVKILPAGQNIAHTHHAHTSGMIEVGVSTIRMFLCADGAVR